MKQPPMKSTTLLAMELQEFFRVPLYSPDGSSRNEHLYVQKGLVPPISEFLEKHSSQLEEALKPRPFVRPIVRRKPREAARNLPPDPSFSVHSNESSMDDRNNSMEAARCLPTPPYEQDQAPSPFIQVPDLYEDLEGIADVAPVSPFPAAPEVSSSTGPSVSTKKSHKFRRKYTARKSTTLTSQPNPYSLFGIRPCFVILEDWKTLYPTQTEKLFKEFFKDTNAPKHRRSKLNDCCNTTDETDNRLVPPLKIRVLKSKPNVHDVLGRIAICPSRATVEENKSAVAQSAQLQDITSPTVLAPGTTHSPSCASPQTDGPPAKKMALIHDTGSVPKLPQTSSIPEAKQKRTHELDGPTSMEMAFPHGTRSPPKIPVPTPSPEDNRTHTPEKSPSTDIPVLHCPLMGATVSLVQLKLPNLSPDARQNTTQEPERPPSESIGFLDDLLNQMSIPPSSNPAVSQNRVHEPAPVKGILKTNIPNNNKHRRVRFLSHYDDKGTDQLLTLPSDVVPSSELNCILKTVVPLSPLCQKEVTLREIAVYPAVCVQCNITFTSRMDLSSHELVNHSSIKY